MLEQPAQQSHGPPHHSPHIHAAGWVGGSKCIPYCIADNVWTVLAVPWVHLSHDVARLEQHHSYALGAEATAQTVGDSLNGILRGTIGKLLQTQWGEAAEVAANVHDSALGLNEEGEEIALDIEQAHHIHLQRACNDLPRSWPHGVALSHVLAF